jgi:ketopantoate reductase
LEATGPENNAAIQMERKIFFYGAGAIGCFYAAMLSRHSDVTLIARKKYIKLKSGVILHGKINKKIKLKVAGSELIKKLPNNSIIFITTKAHSNHEVSKQLKKIIGKGCIIVCLQNGLHVERPFERHIRKRATILRAVTNTALTKVSENKVQVNWIGSVLFPNDKEGRIVHAIFKKSWKNSEISKNIERAIWESLPSMR